MPIPFSVYTVIAYHHMAYVPLVVKVYNKDYIFEKP